MIPETHSFGPTTFHLYLELILITFLITPHTFIPTFYFEENGKCTETLKELHSEDPYTQHLDVIINTVLYLLRRLSVPLSVL